MKLNLPLVFKDFSYIDEGVMFGNFQKIYYLLNHLIFLFGLVNECFFDKSLSIFGQCLSKLSERVNMGHFNDVLF